MSSNCNNDRPGEQTLSTILSPTLTAEMELFIRTFKPLIEPMIDDLIRRSVRDHHFNSLLEGMRTRIPANVMHSSDCQTLQLRFLDKLAKQILTGSKIEGENGTCIKVALVYEMTGEIVKSGPGASARIRILTADGNYMGEEDLNEKINEAKKSSESLLKGNAFISLKEGIGYIDNLSFAHRSDWLKKNKFVLVATLVDSINGITVKAAVMEPFTIKDVRNTLYAKKIIPSLNDDIWRLKNIARRGTLYKCLEKCNIVTVLTFLREFKLNPEMVREIVNCHMSDKAFKATVSHAEKCVFNREELYECNEVVFNIVGDIMGCYFGGYFFRFQELFDENKVIARQIVSSAFKHGNYSPHTINQNKEPQPSIVSHQIISFVNPHQIGHVPGPSSVTYFELRWYNGFSQKLHSPALTGTPLRGEGLTSLQVGLVDSLTGEIVSSGPESSAELEIVLLSPDFAVSNWTTEDFNDKIVRGNGRTRLLSGDVRLNLKDGVGLLHNVYFIHTKYWTAKCEFRLGARVLDPVGIRIREAKTEPFGLRDRRTQLIGRPLLSDNVSRLKCITKNGPYHKRLEKEGINTVKDLWTLLNTNQQKLQTILTGFSTKMWEHLVGHLRTCILDTKLNLYWSSDNQNGVVFNVVGQILGIFENRQYILIQNMSETQKDLAINLVAFALTHLAEVTTFDDEASLFDSLSRLSTLDEPFVAPELIFDEIHFPETENSDLIIEDEAQNQPSPIYDHIVTQDGYQPLPHDPVYSENDFNGSSFWDNPDNNDDEMYNRHMDFPSPGTWPVPTFWLP